MATRSSSQSKLNDPNRNHQSRAPRLGATRPDWTQNMESCCDVQAVVLSCWLVEGLISSDGKMVASGAVSLNWFLAD